MGQQIEDAELPLAQPFVRDDVDGQPGCGDCVSGRLEALT